jgi:hypothetical protein
MNASDDPYNRIYLRVLAGTYLMLCGACSLYYAALDLGAWREAALVPVPWHVQILCLLAALSAGVYFIRPRMGHHGLLAVTLAVLIMGRAGMSADECGFHLIVLMLLCLPLRCHVPPSAPSTQP